jgi:hypothetical protein
MRNERRTSGSGKGAAETCAGNRASAPRPHFHWRRWKGFWKGQYGEGADPGLTYARDSVEVAVRVTSASSALDHEMKLIARLAPRDNQIGQTATAEDEVPF